MDAPQCRISVELLADSVHGASRITQISFLLSRAAATPPAKYDLCWVQGQPAPGGTEGELLLRVHPNVGDLSSLGMGSASAFGYKSFNLDGGEEEREAEEGGEDQADADLTPEEFERIQAMMHQGIEEEDTA